MKKLDINTNDYISLKKCVSDGTKTKELEILAQVISSEDKLSKMTSSASPIIRGYESSGHVQ